MPAPIVCADYEALDSLATRWRTLAAQSEELYARVRAAAAPLETTWLGQAAEAFRAELQGDVVPAVGRLIAALQLGDEVTQTLQRVLHEAEEEAAAVFRDWRIDGDVPMGGSGGGGGGGGASSFLGQVGSAVDTLKDIVARVMPPENATVIEATVLDDLVAGRRTVQNPACPGIAQEYGRVGHTTQWRPGPKLSDHPNLKPGTVIATFDKPGPDGRYPSGDGQGKHTAVFKSYTRDEHGNITGIVVIDHWDGQPPSERSLRFSTPADAGDLALDRGQPGGGASNYADDMYVVTNPSNPAGGS